MRMIKGLQNDGLRIEEMITLNNINYSFKIELLWKRKNL